MTVTKLHAHLSDSQAKYARWLEGKMPYLLPLFDFDKAVYLPEAVERYLGVASHGQAIMARFALGVWRHDNEYAFDFIEAARVLDADLMAIITDWMAEPFWP